jgi:Holliday junction resolvase
MQHKNKFVDLTVSLRFYVCKNELKIRKGDKSKLLGFYRKDNSHNLIGVRYSREGSSKIKFFHIDDPLMIKK